MKKSTIQFILLTLLALVFSIALMFAFIELPRLIDSLLQNNVGFPGFDHGAGEQEAFKTDLYINSLHLRWIGYGSLLIIVIFIILGFTTRKKAFAWAGAISLFLPVFGQFGDFNKKIKEKKYCRKMRPTKTSFSTCRSGPRR